MRHISVPEIFFILLQGLAPFVGDAHRGHGLGIEARHDGAATAAHTAVGGRIHTLLEREALVAYRSHRGLHLKLIVKERGRAEVAVDIYYHDSNIAPAKLIAQHGLEITGLGKVHKREIHAVVQVSEHIDVIEPHLHGHMVAEMLYAAFAIITHNFLLGLRPKVIRL